MINEYDLQIIFLLLREISKSQKESLSIKLNFDLSGEFMNYDRQPIGKHFHNLPTAINHLVLYLFE